MESSGKVVKRIMYVIVLPEESSAIMEKGHFVKEEVKSQEYANILEAFTHTSIDGNEVIIIRPVNDPMHSTSLYGTEIAFFVTYTGIKLFQPDVVCSMGYAGEVTLDPLEKPLGLGSVVIAKEKSIYHRREMIVKCYEMTSQGHYPVLTCEKLVSDLGYHSCTVGTSNSFLRHDEVAIGKNVRVVEMELCSVARACLYFKTPCIGVKIISDGGASDLSEEERVKQFLDSLPRLREQFFNTFGNVNAYLFNKNVTDI